MSDEKLNFELMEHIDPALLELVINVSTRVSANIAGQVAAEVARQVTAQLTPQIAYPVAHDTAANIINTSLNEGLQWQGAVTDIKLESLREQLRPVVNVTLPEMNPTINVETPEVNIDNQINLPKREERDIRFNYDSNGNIIGLKG